MTEQIKLDDIMVDVVFKDISSLRLRICSPAGDARISAPRRMRIDVIRDLVASKLDWIRQHQKKIRERAPQAMLAYKDGELHPVWGEVHVLAIVEHRGRPSVRRQDGRLILQVRPGASCTQRQVLLQEWYRRELEVKVPILLDKWQPVMGVKAAAWSIRQMKTRWGTCNLRDRSICLSLELARRPPDRLEFIVVHELAHLLERSHNARFKAIMDKYLPDWRLRRKQLAVRPL